MVVACRSLQARHMVVGNFWGGGPGGKQIFSLKMLLSGTRCETDRMSKRPHFLNHTRVSVYTLLYAGP